MAERERTQDQAFAYANGAIAAITLLQFPPPTVQALGPLLAPVTAIALSVALVIVLSFRRSGPVLVVGLGALLGFSLLLNAGLVSMLILVALAFATTLHLDGAWRTCGWLLTAVASLALAGPALLAGQGSRAATEQALQNISLVILAIWWAQNVRALEIRRREAGRKVQEQQLVVHSLRELSVVQSEVAVLAERSRIAAELHDQVAGRLSAISLQCALLRESPRLRADEQDILNMTQACSDTTLHEVRALIRALADPGGHGQSNRSRQRFEQTSAVARQLGTRLAVDDRLGEDASDPALAALYAVAQEAVANMLMHAAPCTGSVHLFKRDGVVHLVARNDIRPHQEPRPGTGQGLQNTRRRVFPLGGTVTSGAEPDGRHWTLTAQIPLQGHAPASQPDGEEPPSATGIDTLVRDCEPERDAGSSPLGEADGVPKERRHFMAKATGELVGGLACLVIGLVLWLTTRSVQTPVIALHKVGFVLALVGVGSMLYGLVIAATRKR